MKRYENNYEHFFDKRNSVNLSRNNILQKQLRIPEELWILIRDEMRKLEDNGEKTTYNDFMINILLSFLNINRNKEGELKTGNRMDLNYYINSKKKKK